MALVTKMIVRLMRKPEDGEDDPGDLRSCRGCRRPSSRSPRMPSHPPPIEMLDGVMLRMVEEATHAGYPMDAAAVLLIELEGLRETVEEQVEQIREVCLRAMRANSAWLKMRQERELLWKGRKNAFGAVGRCSAPIITCRMEWCRARKSRRR